MSGRGKDCRKRKGKELSEQAKEAAADCLEEDNACWKKTMQLTVWKKVSGFEAAVIATRVFAPEIAPLLETSDLAAVSLVSKVIGESVKNVLTARNVWDLEDFEDWSRERRACVRHVRVDLLCLLELGKFPTNCDDLRIVSLQITHDTTSSIYVLKLRKWMSKYKSLPELVKDMLPSGLTELQFGNYYNQDIKVGVLPDSLLCLFLGGAFNKPVAAGVLPRGLTHLEFGGGFNQSLTVGMLPCTLTHLRFGSSPMFGGGFNQPLTAGMLPHGLTELAFGFDFNQPVAKGVLPGTLTHLTFGYHFNQPVAKGVLPPTLTHLTFDSNAKFNQPVAKGVLPHGLRKLKFGWNFKHNVEEGALPDTLETLEYPNPTFNRKQVYSLAMSVPTWSY